MRILFNRFLRVGLQTAHLCPMLFILSALALATTAHAVGLNDTGLIDCWSDTNVTPGVEADSGSHPRQDCRYGRDVAAAAGVLSKTGGGDKGFDFSKIANDGTVLDAAAVLGSGAKDWACTRDNVTGLIWEVKTASGLRSQSHTYTWYDSNAATNGGVPGTASGGACFAAGRCDTEKYVADINAAGLCGAADWRMPSLKELESIVHYSRYVPSIDTGYFPNTGEPGSSAYFQDTGISTFWSSITLSLPLSHAFYSASAWGVDFLNGVTQAPFKSGTFLVRLVRGGQ